MVYGCRVHTIVPRPTRNSSIIFNKLKEASKWQKDDRVAASVALIGNRFHSLMGLRKNLKKEFL